MNPTTLHPPADSPLPANPGDEDLAEQARPGHGIPSQDPDPGAQQPLSADEAQREGNSVLMGGAILALRAEVVRPSTGEIVLVAVWAVAVMGALRLIRQRVPPPRRRATPSHGDGRPRSG